MPPSYLTSLLGRIALERHECSQHVEISLAWPLMSKVETLFVDFKAEIALVYVTKCSNWMTGNVFCWFQENSIKVSNSLDPDQARLFIGPDLGPTCLQRPSADDTCSTLDKQRICVNTQSKSSKKQLKWYVCVPKSNSNDRYAITCDVIAYHLVHFVSIQLINKCQSGIDFIFASERAIYSTFMKISVPSQAFCGKTKWKWWKWNFAK